MELKLKHRDTIDFSKHNPGDLVYIGVYTSGRCGLRCLYCFESACSADEKETALEERISTIGQAKLLGAEVMLVAGAGEPLCDPCFPRMVEAAFAHGLGTLLYTSGLEVDSLGAIRPISPESARHLHANDVTVIMKLESVDPEIHDGLTGVVGSWEGAMHSLDVLLEAGYGQVEGGVTRLGLAALYTKPSLENLLQLRMFADNLGTKLVVDVVGVHGRAEEHPEIIPTVREIIQTQRQLGPESGMAATGQCLYWRYGLIIDHHGEARYCTEIETHDIGNIRQMSVEELLRIKNTKYPASSGGFTCPLKEIHYLGK